MTIKLLFIIFCSLCLVRDGAAFKVLGKKSETLNSDVSSERRVGDRIAVDLGGSIHSRIT
jgi:hypothetical protein